MRYKWGFYRRTFVLANLKLALGVFLAFIIIVVLPTLEFYHKNPSPIQWSTEHHYEDDGSYGGIKHIATRNGEVIYTSEIIRRNERFNRPQLDPPRHERTLVLGEWYAPIDGVRAGVLVSAMVLLAILYLWTLIHFLMSLYRMICAAKENNTQQPV